MASGAQPQEAIVPSPTGEASATPSGGRVISGTPSSGIGPAQSEPPPLRWWHKVSFHVLSFFAYWVFGPSVLDTDGDGDFDEDDLRRIIDNCRAFIGLRRKMVKKPRRRKAPGESSTPVSSAAMSGKAAPPSRAPAQQPPPASGEQPGQSRQEERRGSGGSDGTRGSARQVVDQVVGAARNAADLDGDGKVTEMELAQAMFKSSRVRAEEASDTRIRHWPFFTLAHIVIATMLWLVMSFEEEGKAPFNQTRSWAETRAGLDSFDPGAFDLRNFDLDTCERLTHEFWRWFLYQYTHIGLQHVALNSLLVVMLGMPLELLHGGIRMFVIFNAGVVAGALNTFLFDIHKSVVGMSGGCYALVSFHLADLIVNWGTKHYRRGIVLLVLVMVAVEWIPSYLSDPESERVSQTAHTGGFLGGLAAGIIFGYNPPDTKKSERTYFGLDPEMLVVAARLICAALYCSLAAIAIIYAATEEADVFSVGWKDPWDAPDYCGVRLLYDPTRRDMPTPWICELIISEERMTEVKERYEPNSRLWRQAQLSQPIGLSDCWDDFPVKHRGEIIDNGP